MENNFRLSLSMLISRYTDQFEQCLTSIQPFFDAFPTEFIVVDTGAPTEAIELAKKYATQIVHFEWCNDFSKARNVGLRLCSGDWFLYLDDDEYFDNVQPIIDFLNSDASSNYTTASYDVHNYYSYDSDSHNCEQVIRMVKRVSNLSFKHSVHEIFDPVGLYKNTYHTSAFTHHYGYVAITPEEYLSHAKRNIPLLLHECTLYPEDYRLALHLANEYTILSQFTDTVQFLDPWIEKLKNNTLPSNEYMHNWMLENYFQSLFSLQNFSKIQNLALDLIHTDLIGLVCKWTVSYYGGLSSALLGQHQLAADLLNVFFLIDDSINQHSDNQWLTKKYHYSADKTASQVNLANKFMCVCSYNVRNYQQANTYLSQIDFSESDIFELNQICQQIANFLATLS